MREYDRMPRLGPRLRLAASFVRPGGKAADIGTDHAYLPIYLVKSGVSICAVAADIGEGPLERARRNVDRVGLAFRVLIRRSDGLSNIRPDEADDIIITGMGGDLIIRILSACAFSKRPELRFVLSPNSRASRLRAWLYAEGFAILRERAAYDAGRLYTVMQAAYTGRPETDVLTAHIGGLCVCPGRAELDYLHKELRILQKQVLGYQKGERLSERDNILELTNRMKREIENCKREDRKPEELK